jgi:hypothetical protein
MALMGAEALFYPTAIGTEPPPAPPVDSRHHWRRVMQGHAGANYVPLIASNRIGTEKGATGEMTFYGTSFIAGPTGEIVADLDSTHEGVCTASFDLDEIARMRASWGLFRDRRPDLYAPIRGHDGCLGVGVGCVKFVKTTAHSKPEPQDVVFLVIRTRQKSTFNSANSGGARPLLQFRAKTVTPLAASRSSPIASSLPRRF